MTKYTRLKILPLAWGIKPHIRGFCSPRCGGFQTYILVVMTEAVFIFFMVYLNKRGYAETTYPL